eukprot:CAMPEP_0174247668 /NCGR_PEP_ID=MMETSP0417-20130205/42691_1 /TAXON_ID=242541 /ORGANISM="Mayorella sp, Strain BSH-02190019" /LENGTH=581 /DNA_ID=CAMNT_0015327529 /DNA_START=29 /DNA_END=1774 /DNA_ORIENTATION=+
MLSDAEPLLSERNADGHTSPKTRRLLVVLAVLCSLVLLISVVLSVLLALSVQQDTVDESRTFSSLAGYCSHISPIQPAELAERRELLSARLSALNQTALWLESGAAMFYYTGVQWKRSERPLLWIQAHNGSAWFVCPRFELRRALLAVQGQAPVLTWDEHLSPYPIVAELLRAAAAPSTTVRTLIGTETRYFVVRGVSEQFSESQHRPSPEQHRFSHRRETFVDRLDNASDQRDNASEQRDNASEQRDNASDQRDNASYQRDHFSDRRVDFAESSQYDSTNRRSTLFDQRDTFSDQAQEYTRSAESASAHRSEKRTAHRSLENVNGTADVLVIQDGGELIDAQRMLKSAAEIDILRCVNRATKAAIQAVAPLIRVGMHESELAQLLTEAQAAAGLSGVWVLSLFGANAAFPHGTEASVTLQEGMLALIDTGGELLGYQSDISRTFALGELSNQTQLNAWLTVQQAQRSALDRIRWHLNSSVSLGSLDAEARRVVSQNGFGSADGYEYFSHRLGHGIGTQGHENPYLVLGNPMTLLPGMTFSVEPGLYLENEWGVRLEDIVLVTNSTPGYEVFGSLQETPSL